MTAVLLAGCGDDGTSTDTSAGGDEAGEQTDTPGDGTSGDAGGSDDSEDGSSEGDDTTADGSDAGADDVQTIEVAVVDGVATPAFDTYQVALGDQVRIEITSDVADELHMHGYDLELELEPGVPGILEFTADIEGRFELETHETALQLLQLEVQ
jgi:hypothetical protein